MGGIAGDVRQALRRLSSTPLLSAGALVILALGIGSAVVMADILDRLLLRAPSGVADPDRVALVYVGGIGQYAAFTDYATVQAIATLHDEIESTAAYREHDELTLGRGPAARRITATDASSDYFDVLGVRPAVGSWAAWSSPRQRDVAVISNALWRQDYGASPDVVGKPLALAGGTYTIIAVAPRGFTGIGEAADVWLPLAQRAEFAYGAGWQRQPFLLHDVARLRPDVNRDRVNTRATALYRATHTQPWERSRQVRLGDLRPARAPGAALGSRVEVLVAGMSILVLLITCGNVANLLLVRGLLREREFVVKTALGASRPRLLREVMSEAALLAAAAGVLAWIVVLVGGSVMRRLFMARAAAVASPLDPRLLAITVGFCIAAAFLLGAAPAIRLTTRRALNPGQSPVKRPSRLLDLFAGLQVALSLPAIVAAALFVASLWNAEHQDFGIHTGHVAVVRTNLFEIGRPNDNEVVHRRMQERIARLPVVESTALVANVPMLENVYFLPDVDGKHLEGPVSSETGLLPSFNGVDPSFFAVMGMRLVAGRLFTDDDNQKGRPPVAVISQSMARNYWPSRSALGGCIYVGGRKKPCTRVVGIVADARLFASLDQPEKGPSACYLPIEQSDITSNRALLVRTNVDPDRALASLRREAQAAGPDLPYVSATAFDEVFQGMLRPWRLGSTVFLIFGVLSMLVAAVGLGAVTAYAVVRRTREIGIRSALGAAPNRLVQLVLGRTAAIMASGVVAGLGLAWVSGRILSSQLFGIHAGDLRVLAASALGLLAVGAAAAWLPARRAARVDPVSSLRAE